MLKFLKVTCAIFFLNFIFLNVTNASSLKLLGGFGASQYRDYSVTGKWSVSGSKSKTKLQDVEKEQSEGESEAKILTSVESTKSSGSITNDYKLGYDSKINEITSYDLIVYNRAEPSNVGVIGFNPEFDFDYEVMGFTTALDFSRSSTDLPVGPKKTVTQSFTSAGVSLGVYREFFEVLKASLTASFYHYTEPQTKFPTQNKRRLMPPPTSGTGLSTTGYPEKVFTFGLNWDWADQWSSTYSISRTKTHFDGATSVYSSLGTDHTFSSHWASGVAYAWSSAGSSVASLDATYFW